MIRSDLLTGEKFYPSRITQKFSCAENRIKYNNRKANELRHSIMYVNSPLHKNIRILNELMEGKEKEIFHKQFLLGKGYSFDVLTNFHDIDGKEHPCVYQFCMQFIEDDLLTFTKIKKILP